LKDTGWPETHPLGGTETACLHMVAALRELGHAVEILTEASELKANACDVFISVRFWALFEPGVRFGKLQYIWCHDDVQQPFLESLEKDIPYARTIYKRVDGFILLSYYQYHRWLQELKLPHEKVFVSSNGISYEAFNSRYNYNRRPPHAYYASAPFRGLHLLLKAWPMIQGAVPQAQLNVFSSMKVYSQEEKARYYQMYEEARSLSGVNYRGAVSQSELRETALQSRVLAYPCVFPETSCIAAMEAMAAGCVVVSTPLGAMRETAWRNPLVSAFEEGWLDTWAMEVARLFVDDDYFNEISIQNREFARFLDWGLVAKRWLLRFQSDLSRQIKTEISI
jgi:glycosyltransferase involved in cell wall biosynthesis